MARIYGSVSQRPESYDYFIEWEEHGVDAARNISHVTARVYVYCKAHNAYQSNLYQALWINGVKFENTLRVDLSPGTTVELVSGTVYNIPHNSDGSKAINIRAESSPPNGSGWGPLYGSASGDVWLTHIPRQANFQQYYVSLIDINSLLIYYKLDKAVSSIQYSLNGGAWTDVSVVSGSWQQEATIKIDNLNINTAYNIRLKANVNGLDTYTNYMYATTKDSATITILSDFNLGDSVRVAKINPSGYSNTLKVIAIKEDKTEVLIREILNAANDLTITFTQDELDKIYKAMPRIKNSIQIRFYLATLKENLVWSKDKYVNCILTGDMKTAHYKNTNEAFKRARVFYKTNENWRNAVLVIKKNGVWERCI